MRTYVTIDEKLKPAVDCIQDFLATSNMAYIVRVAIVNFHQKILHNNIDTSIFSAPSDVTSLAPDIGGLAGMDLDVVESHFVRFRKFHPTVEIYRSAIAAVKAEAAERGEPLRNPEAALYGKLKAWSLGKWRPDSPSAPAALSAGLKSQKEIERELYGA
jgi:hypothetical protein